jgi:Tfp pilus assembly protein FimT
MRSNRKRHVGCAPRDGSSLIELVIVVAIIAVVTLLAVTSFRDQAPGYRLDGAVGQLATDLCSARMQAIAENLPVKVSLDTASKEYTIWADRNTNGVADAEEKEVNSLSSVSGLELSTLGSHGTFAPRGSFAASLGQVWLIRLRIDEAESSYVYVLPSGQVQWTKESEGWDDYNESDS